MDKEEILRQLAEAERDIKEAKSFMAQKRREWTDAETALIHAKLKKERLTEALRINRVTVPSSNPELTLRELDIEEFRAKHPELCEWAKDRDIKKSQS